MGKLECWRLNAKAPRCASELAAGAAIYISEHGGGSKMINDGDGRINGRVNKRPALQTRG